MKQVSRVAAVLGLGLSAVAWAGSPPVHESLVRFPQVKPGGEFVVTQGIERPLVVRYGRDVAPATFRATLNGESVTKLFSPSNTAKSDSVRLPIKPGQNVLRIEVNSLTATRDPKSALLPQEHLLSIRVVPMTSQPLTSTRTYTSKKELDASARKAKEQFDLDPARRPGGGEGKQPGT